MIPEPTIDKAMRAYVDAEGAYCSRDSLVSALEAVAADIWDQAIAAASEQGTIQEPDNPYRAEAE